MRSRNRYHFLRLLILHSQFGVSGTTSRACPNASFCELPTMHQGVGPIPEHRIVHRSCYNIFSPLLPSCLSTFCDRALSSVVPLPFRDPSPVGAHAHNSAVALPMRGFGVLGQSFVFLHNLPLHLRSLLLLHTIDQPYNKLLIYLYNTAARLIIPNLSSWGLYDPTRAQGTSRSLWRTRMRNNSINRRRIPGITGSSVGGRPGRTPRGKAV